MYRGQVVPANQIHDFNPGIRPFPGGLFWTVRIPSESVEVDLEDGTASLDVSRLHLEDYFTLANALADGKSVAAQVSFKIHWQGVTKRTRVHDPSLHVAGLFLDTGAHITWEGQNAQGFEFESHSAGQKVVFAQIAHERNGAFFN